MAIVFIDRVRRGSRKAARLRTTFIEDGAEPSLGNVQDPSRPSSGQKSMAARPMWRASGTSMTGRSRIIGGRSRQLPHDAVQALAARRPQGLIVWRGPLREATAERASRAVVRGDKDHA
jgi:hypothetical protein